MFPGPGNAAAASAAVGFPSGGKRLAAGRFGGQELQVCNSTASTLSWGPR